MTLKQAIKKQWVKQAEKKLLRSINSLRVINQQFWCCCGGDGIVVFDSDLQQQRTTPADMGDVCDVAESHGDVIIATGRGLYRVSNGKWH